jgi:hypothetical protein
VVCYVIIDSCNNEVELELAIQRFCEGWIVSTKLSGVGSIQKLSSLAEGNKKFSKE